MQIVNTYWMEYIRTIRGTYAWHSVIRCIYSLSLLKELSDLLVEWLYRTFTGFNRCNMLAASRGLAHAAKILLRHPGLDFISATLLGCFHALHLPFPTQSFRSSYKRTPWLIGKGAPSCAKPSCAKPCTFFAQEAELRSRRDLAGSTKI